MRPAHWRSLGAAAYLLLCLGPAALVVSTGGNPALALPDSRRMGLLQNTVSLGLFVSLLCTVLGTLAALCIYSGRMKNHPLRWWFLLLAPVPQYIYALSWMQLVRLWGRLWPALLRIRICGFFPCAAVETLAFLPFCTALALLGLERQNVDRLKAGLICKGGNEVLYRICLPQLLPWTVSGAGCVFVLSAGDFSIPSLFQYNVYAMELFSDFSAYGRAANSFWLALPLMLLSMLAVCIFEGGLRYILTPTASGGDTALRIFGPVAAACRAALMLCVFQTAVPLFSLGAGLGSLSELFDSAALSYKELWVSCRIGLLAAAIALPPSCAAAALLSSGKRLWRFLFLLPMAVPGALSGAGWLTAISASHVRGLTRSVWLPALGCAGRFMPFCALVLTAVFLRLDSRRIEAARLLQSRRTAAFFKVLLPMAAPALLSGGLLVSLLSLGDVSVTLMLAPPGMEPFSIKVYNYLHYGASSAVSGFCLITVLGCALITALIMRLLHLGRQNYD